MKKKMFSLMLVLVISLSTFASGGTVVHCNECGATWTEPTTIQNTHFMGKHIQIWAKQFIGWFSSLSTPFDLNG